MQAMKVRVFLSESVSYNSLISSFEIHVTTKRLAITSFTIKCLKVFSTPYPGTISLLLSITVSFLLVARAIGSKTSLPLLSSVMSTLTTTDTISTDDLVQEVMFNCRVLIRDKPAFLSKVQTLKEGGSKGLNVITDFDFTLSTFHNTHNTRAYSCHKLIEDSGLLSHEYHAQAQAVQAYYYPIEIDPSIPHEERVQHMIDWAHKSHALLVQYGLTKDVLQSAVVKAVQTQEIRLRQGVSDFFLACKQHTIPILVFSAGIADVLENVLSYHMNIHYIQPEVISNRCIFDAEGHIQGFQEPVIHVFNKRTADFMDHSPFFAREDRLTRKNLLLIGNMILLCVLFSLF